MSKLSIVRYDRSLVILTWIFGKRNLTIDILIFESYLYWFVKQTQP